MKYTYICKYISGASRAWMETYKSDCWHGALCRTSIERIDLVIPETEQQIQNWLLLVESVSNDIIHATSLTECFKVKRNMETIISNFTSDILYRHRCKFLKLIYKIWIINLNMDVAICWIGWRLKHPLYYAT